MRGFLRTWVSALLAGAVLVGVGGCAQLRTEMAEAQRAYERERYEDALVWLTDLEDDVPEMDRRMRARFYYLRGRTAYELGQRDDALHYLALAREEVALGRAKEARRAVLPPEWAEDLEARLSELTPTERGAFHAREAGGSSGGEAPQGS